MFYSYNTKEKLLFPPDLGDLIPQGAPVRLICDIIERLNLSKLIDQYSDSKEGHPAYHPVMMLRVIIYGYMSNIYSLRGLEEAMTRDVHLIWLSCYQFPDHSTIGNFKSKCSPLIKEIFAQIVVELVKMGEIELSEDLYIDGTTIRSRAARLKIKWRSNAERYSAMADEKIQSAVKQLLEQVDEGAASDAEHTPVHYTPEQARAIADKVEEKLQGKKNGMGAVSATREACDRKETHDQTVKECAGRCGVSPTDPDCGIMHAKEDGYDGLATPNYNVQVATQNQYITNFDVYDTPSDKDTALDFIDTCIAENGVTPQAVIEDAGYGCEEVYVGMEERGIDPVIKFPNYDAMTNRRPTKAGEYDKFGFKLTADGTSLICPAGHVMKPIAVRQEYTKRGFRSDTTTLEGTHCHDCPFTKICCVTKNKDRQIRRKLGNIRAEEKAKENLDKQENQIKLKRRSLEPEPVFGQLKHNRGYQRFRHFGKTKVTTDLGFMLIALNVLKLHRNKQKRG